MRKAICMLLSALCLFMSAAFPAPEAFAMETARSAEEYRGIKNAASIGPRYQDYSFEYGLSGGRHDTGFTYGDSLLLRDNRTMWPELAKISVGLSAAAYVDVGDSPDSLYCVLRAMGYSVIPGIGNYDRVHTADDNDFVRYTIAVKELTDGGIPRIVYCVVVQGTRGSYDWDSNFNLGSGEDHEGFYRAREEIVRILCGQMQRDACDAGHTILWTTGHSRGAAVSNIVAGEFTGGSSGAVPDTDLSALVAPERVFSYNFACPAVSKRDEVKNANCGNIFNFNNPDDLVPVLPLPDWGYMRYGIDDPDLLDTDSANFRQRFLSEREETYAGTEDTVQTISAMLSSWAAESPDPNSQSWQILFKLLARVMRDDQKSLRASREAAGPGLAEQMDGSSGPADRDDLDSVFEEEGGLPGHTEDAAAVYGSSDGAGEKGFLQTQIALTNYLLSNDVSAAVKHAHEPLCYVLAVNSMYYGYAGWAGFDSGFVPALDETGRLITVGAECFADSQITALQTAGNIQHIGIGAFRNAGALSSAELRDGLLELMQSAFSGCAALTEIRLPASVTLVDSNAFSGCAGLNTVRILSADPALPAIGDNAFDRCGSALCLRGFPDSAAEQYAAACGYRFLSLGVVIGGESFPDADFRALISGRFDLDGDGFLDELEAAAVRELDISGPTGGEPGPYTSLRGVECFPSLEALRCANNRLTALELRGLCSLKTLDCSRNALTSLDLTGCPVLLAVTALAEPEPGADGSVSYLAEAVGAITVDAGVTLCAPVLRLPAMLTEIGSEAFAGIEAATVIIPEGVTRMEDGAFSDVVIIGVENSEAAAYAKRNNCRFFPYA